MEYCAEKQQLGRLRQQVAASSSSDEVAGALEAVVRVYEHAEPLLARSAVAQIDDELRASVVLLDACAAARDALGAMRACACDVEAAVRRGDRAAVNCAARAYARIARNVRADVRRLRRRGGSLDQDAGHSPLQEARRLTVAVLERVVAAPSKRVAAVLGRPASGWSTCVARAFRKRARVACDEDADETSDSLSSTLSSSKDSHHGEVASRARRELRELGDTIQRLEDGLELLFRRMVQCRVLLLNIHSL